MEGGSGHMRRRNAVVGSKEEAGEEDGVEEAGLCEVVEVEVGSPGMTGRVLCVAI